LTSAPYSAWLFDPHDLQVMKFCTPFRPEVD
jgi:hypothetical protein